MLYYTINGGVFMILTEKRRVNRRDFLKGIYSLAAVASAPALFTACAGNPGGSGNNPGGATGNYFSFEVQFSKTMNTESVEDAIVIAPLPSDNQPVIEWRNGDSLLYCRYSESSAGNSYTVTIGSGASDTSGRYLDGNGDGTAGDPYTFNVASV